MGENKVLIFLAKDHRPSLDHLVVLLLNLENGDLIDYLDTKMELKNISGEASITIKKKGPEYKVRLVTEYLEDVKNDTIDNFIESWVSIKVIDNKVVMFVAK